MKKSVWRDSAKLPVSAKLQGDIKTDVLIIGGGMAGILCAYFLKKRNIDYILAEGNSLASGVTENTTAKITALHGLIYKKMLNTIGKEKAQMYLRANLDAVKEFETLCGNIDCDFEKRPAYTYSLENRKKIEDEVNAVNELGFPAKFSKTKELPFKTKGAVYFENQAQFNPLKFISEISYDLNIYEHTFVKEIEKNTALTDNGKITAKKIIVATHFPFINKHGSYFLKLYQHRSYVSAFKNAPEIKGMYVDENDNGLSFRSYNDLLLIGGGGHRTGKTSTAWEGINSFADKVFPKADPVYQWSTQDCISLDRIPYIGNYSKNTPDMYVATGFNKWGMTSSIVSAILLADMIEGKKNDFSEVFSPQRSILKPQLFANGFESAMNLLAPSKKRCPHLGCALKWNKAEHSWDCPCHGSRFSKDGKLINNPATGDLK